MPNELAGRFPLSEQPAEADIPPSPRWRSRRAGSRLDRGTKRLAAIAAAIGGVLLLMAGAWSLVSHRSQGVAVLEPPSGPLRVKPENRGGMQVTGIDEPLLSGDLAAGKEKEALAPPPELPQPKALGVPRAPEKPKPGVFAPSSPRLAASALPATAAVPAPAAGQPIGGTAKPVTPLTRITTLANSAPANRDAAKPAAEAGGLASQPVKGGEVQLAALKSEAAAKTEWARLAKRMPDLLGRRRPEVVRVERDGHVFWRLRTGGFGDPVHASRFCEQVRTKGADCSIATF